VTTARIRRGLAAAALAGLVATTSGCGIFDGGSDEPKEAATSTAAAAVFDAQFTRDGTFQSHIQVKGAKGVDFVYTLYPTKATPRTNEWYPEGDKFFTMTLTAYDLNQDLRDPFETKRLVYLSHITGTSATTTSAGGATEHPFSLDARAPQVTFDPEPVTTDLGMLITSPKGAFELRNQKIGSVSADTIGVTLQLIATVSIETSAGSGEFIERKVKQSVPIAIFESDTPTVVADIPVNAN
jgi:hypothetical protein